MKKKKIVTIIGARPQFIKYAALQEILTDTFNDHLVHTGQHYDYEMNQSIFMDLKIKEPYINLNVGSLSHSFQTAQIMQELEPILLKIKPEIIIVFGDTNSTLAASLTAAKLHIPIAHIEAGLRSFNKNMPEEINRLCSDHLSELLFCPTRIAVENLFKEGIKDGVVLSGDVMKDIILRINKKIKTSKFPRIMKTQSPYVYLTLHRQENTNNPNVLKKIFNNIGQLSERVIFPIHPRTKKIVKTWNIKIPSNIELLDPVNYTYSIVLQKYCDFILTDSGGIQKEAYLLKKPCITVRRETEWLETLDGNCNQLVGHSYSKLIRAIDFIRNNKVSFNNELYGNGESSKLIVNEIRQYI